jgi:hypothetical protein
MNATVQEEDVYKSWRCIARWSDLPSRLAWTFRTLASPVAGLSASALVMSLPLPQYPIWFKVVSGAALVVAIALWLWARSIKPEPVKD